METNIQLVLKDEYVNKDIIITFYEKGQQWHYTLKRLKPNQYQKLFDNGYEHLFDIVVTGDMPLNAPELDEVEEKQTGLIDNTTYKKKAVTARKNKKNDNL